MTMCLDGNYTTIHVECALRRWRKMAAASHVGCASAIIRDCTVMNCDHMRRDCTVILLLGSCIVEIGSVVACHDAARDEKSTKKQSKTAVSSCAGRVHVHIGCDSYDVRDVRGMLLGCLEQTKLMVLFAKHELCSEKKYLSCASRVSGRKQLFSAMPAV